MRKEPPEKANSGQSLTKAGDKHPDIGSSLPAEVIQALDASASNVDVNVLLVQLIKKEPSSTEFLAQSRQIMDMAKEFEEWRLSQFKERTNAVIDAKNRDPDEIDKRANNGARRFLKRTIGILALLALLAAGAGLWLGAPALVMVMLLAVVALSTTFAGVLATGESVTTENVVQVLREISRGTLVKLPQDNQETQPNQSSRRRK
jgi:hypothetical protein